MARLTIAERFWSKVDKTGDCWLWMAASHTQGYGHFCINRRTMFAHRLAWEFTHGPIPIGACVCHRCDVPACCNPSHLFIGTHLDNMRDMTAKGRAVHQQGHEHGRAKLTAAEVLAIRIDPRSQTAISFDYDVSQTTIHRILRGKTWTHI